MVIRYGCVLCGIGIVGRPLSESEEWLREYRAGEFAARGTDN